MKTILSGFFILFFANTNAFAQDSQSDNLTQFGGNKYQIIVTNESRNAALRAIQEQGQITCQKSGGKNFTTISQFSTNNKTDENKTIYTITTIFSCQ